MKVICDNCSAQYKIPDHKLVKEVNKATCRKCGHRMLIRRQAPPEPEPIAGPLPELGDEEQTLISRNPGAAEQAIAQQVAAHIAPGSPALSQSHSPHVSEWEDEQPTKLRSMPENPHPDVRPTTPGVSSSSSPMEPTEVYEDIHTPPEPAPPPAVPRKPVTPGHISPTGQRAPKQQPAQKSTAKPRAAQAQQGHDPSGDLSWAVLGTLAAIAGTLLLAANLSGSAIQRFLGLLLALGGSSATLFILVTGSRGSKKASLLISTLLSGVLAFGGAAALHLLHVSYATWSTPKPPTLASAAPVIPTAPPPAVEDDAEDVEDAEDAAEALATEAAELLASAEIAPITPPEQTTSKPPSTTSASSPSTASTAEPEPEPEPVAVSPAPTVSTRPSSDDDLDELFASAEPEPEPEPEPDHSASAVLLPTVVDTILRNNKGVKNCFQREYKRSGSLPRSLPVGFKVRTSGSVSSTWVNGTYQGSELEDCLQGAFAGVQFPPFDGSTKTMSYTFRL